MIVISVLVILLLLLSLMDSEDGGEHGGKAGVALNPTEERRSSFEKLDLSSYPDSAVDTVDKGFGRCGL
jgi:hypothetical protein